ncbi:hypothetical protein H0H93_012243, partial [Arthromyces matolae]
KLSEIKKVISSTHKLVSFGYGGWDNGSNGWQDAEYAVSISEKRKYSKEWEEVCPDLQYVDFSDGQQVNRMGELWR